MSRKLQELDSLVAEDLLHQIRVAWKSQVAGRESLDDMLLSVKFLWRGRVVSGRVWSCGRWRDESLDRSRGRRTANRPEYRELDRCTHFGHTSLPPRSAEAPKRDLCHGFLDGAIDGLVVVHGRQTVASPS